jgi:hypothetical protein
LFYYGIKENKNKRGLALGVLDLKNSEAVFTRNVSGMCEITLKFKQIIKGVGDK